MADVSTQLKVLSQFLGKSDGRDKLTATIQYVCMFISAGEAGNAKKIQGNVAAARKVFRVMRPLEALTPLITNPKLNPSKPVLVELINKLKFILNAIYFGGDHVVWSYQAGIQTNKELTDSFQKASLYGWLGASLCTLIGEIYEIRQLYALRRGGLPADEWRAKKAKAVEEGNARVITLVHASVQALLAVGLLQLRPWKPRTVGLLGTIASLLNCYMLYPALPAPPAKLAPVKEIKDAKALPVAPKLDAKAEAKVEAKDL